MRAINWVLLSAILFFMGTPMPASALTFSNLGARVGPKTVSSGGRVEFFIGMQSPEAVSNVTITFEVRPYTISGGISPSVVHKQVLTGQNFSAGQTKEFSRVYTIPPELVTGDYLWMTKATNAAGTVVYFQAGRVVDNYTFHVNGAPVRRYRRGINLMDLGNAGGVLPGTYGTTYSKPTLASLQYLKSLGHDVVRIPFIWERIQPDLNKGLDTNYKNLLLQTLIDANTAGLKVIVDMHNYGRYTSLSGVKRAFGEPGGPTKEQYAQAWSLIASAIKADARAYSAVYAYDIMNEPHDLPHTEGTLSNAVSISSFESSLEGWVAQSSEVIGRESRNGQGSMKITGAAVTGDNKVFGARLYSSTKSTSITNGRTFQVKVFVPTTTPGSVRARMVMSSMDWSTNFFSDEFPITKGIESRVYFNPDEALWASYKVIGIQFIVDGTNGSAPHVFYVDQVSQGTRTGEIKPAQQWELYSQEVVNKLRTTNNDSMLIMVEGYSWSSAELWPKSHPRKWITDSYNNIMYHAHIYMDALDDPEYPDDGGGKYRSHHDVYLAEARKKGHASVGAYTVARVKPFTDWVAAQGTQGFIGEYGWPSTQMHPNDKGAWEADGEEFLGFLDSIGMGATMWTSGSWEKLPACNILNAYELEPVFNRLSQAYVLERHLGNP
ncbi:glycoside hydrolase family 5 protein [Archangium lipolyticum]|uniref:glycoside hydrolase family 5 protein n=1 Tax=Archangium lipolyticum TaxID=2970465 RepID=UPI00214A026B|nr:glycoside hydrolase family 5 protein [Archangium lipolyticum]